MKGAYYAHIRIKIGNDIFLSESENIMQINVKYHARNIIQFSLEVYDEMAHIVEDKIIETSDKYITIWYGYDPEEQGERNCEAGPFECIITKIGIDFIGVGEVLTIEGISVAIGSNLIAEEIEKYENTRISGIFIDMCNRIGWVPHVVRTKPMQVNGTDMSSNIGEDMYVMYREVGMSILDFIDQLKLYAVSEDGKSEYVFDIEEKGGETHAYFRPSSTIEQKNQQILTFQVGVENEDIIEFKPVIGEYLFAISGKDGVSQQLIDSSTSNNCAIESNGTSDTPNTGSIKISDSEVPLSGGSRGTIPEPIKDGPNKGQTRYVVSIEFRSKSSYSILSKSSFQRAALSSSKLKTDGNGIGYFVINGEKRYAVALTSSFGGDGVGHLVDMKMNDGVTIKMVKCDQKRTNNKAEQSDYWGHMNGLCVTELFLSINDKHGYEYLGSSHKSYPVGFNVVGKIDKNFL